MSHARIVTQLGAPPALAFRALGEILREIASRQGIWRGFPLHIDLGDTGVPDVGYIAVPITLEVQAGKPGLQQLDVTFRAAQHPESFPAFNGAFGVDSTGPTGAALWIAGTYDVPLHGIGKVLDLTLMRDIAQTTLKNFLDDLAVACHARIEKGEAQYARYRMLGRTP